MKHLFVSILLSVSGAAALAQVTVSDPWVRATVPVQKATGAFMTLTPERDGRLIEARSPVAGAVEIHEMVMQGDVMKMRALPTGLSMTKGKAVVFKSGSYHFMLLDLKQQMKAGDTIPIQLIIENNEGKRTTVEIKALVKPLSG